MPKDLDAAVGRLTYDDPFPGYEPEIDDLPELVENYWELFVGDSNIERLPGEKRRKSPDFPTFLFCSATPGVLNFRIHWPTDFYSKYIGSLAWIEKWSWDLKAKDSYCVVVGSETLPVTNSSIYAGGCADELFAGILAEIQGSRMTIPQLRFEPRYERQGYNGEVDHWLEWKSKRRVRVLVNEIFPDKPKAFDPRCDIEEWRRESNLKRQLLQEELSVRLSRVGWHANGLRRALWIWERASSFD